MNNKTNKQNNTKNCADAKASSACIVRRLDDYDVWYQPCVKCGYDTGKSTKPKEGNKVCWKCGNFIKRDYSERALKST